MEPVMVYAGEDFVNVALRLAHASRREAFRGSGASRGVAYTFDVAEPPVARLVADRPTHNVALDLPEVIVGVRGGRLGFTKRLAVRATGTLMLVDAMPALTGVRLAADEAGVLDRVVVRLIEARVLPRIASALAAVRLGQLGALFGPVLPVELRSGEVIDGPALRLGARIVGASDIAAADAPAPGDVARLSGASDGSALIVAFVSAGALNAAMQALLPPLTRTFDLRRHAPGVGIRGTVTASPPVLDVRDDRATARTIISFAGLQAGTRLPLGRWAWVSLPAPTAEVVVGHVLSASLRRGQLTLTGVDSFDPSFGWPQQARPVEAIAKRLLVLVVSRLRHRIAGELEGRALELVTLPSTLAGVGAIDLAFAEEGLAYVGGSLRARVRLRPVAAPR